MQIIGTILALLCLLQAAPSRAQQYYFRDYQVEDGLSHNTVFCVAQDKQGFIWAGTKDGLNRFDGREFRVFREKPGDSSAIGNNFIFSLCVDDNGQLYAGTGNGLYRYHAATESFERAPSPAGQDANALRADRQGNLWYLSWGRLYRYNPTKNISEPITGSYIPGNLSSVHVSKKGSVWIANAQGEIRRLGDSLHKWDVWRGSPKPHTRHITHLLSIPDGRLLVGTANQGLKLLDPEKNTYEDLVTWSDGDVGVYVRFIAHHSGSEYWIATESGIYIVNIATKKHINLRKQYNNPYSLTDNAIYCLHQDREGGMWAGSYFGGVNYYPKQYTYFEKYWPDNSGQTLSGNAVREICQDRYGNIWAGTEDNGVNRVDIRTGQIRQYTPRNNSSKALSHTNIHGLYADGNQLWIGTLDKGVDVMDIRTGQTVAHYSAGPESFGSNFILYFYRTRDGDMLVGTGSELARFDSAAGRFRRVEEVPHASQRSIAEAADGTLWMATSDNGVQWYRKHSGEHGMYTHDPRDSFSLSGNNVNTVLIDRAQRIWAGTEGRGICRLDGSGRWRRYTTAEGLPSDYIFRLLEDRRGMIWATTSRGLVCLEPESGAVKIFTTSHGLLNNQFNYNSGFQDKDGNMYIGSVKGMIRFNPDHFLPDTSAAPVYITGMEVRNMTMGPQEKRDIHYSKKITLPYHKANFSIAFAALSFTAPDMISYAYRMEGLDNDWIWMKSNRTVYFTDLKPGHYTFHVATTDANGNRRPGAAMLQIEITPPFWATSWAYLLYTLALISTGYYAIARYHRQQTMKQKRRMEALQLKKEKELYQAKVDFLTNVAHEINTPLTLIKGPLEEIMEHPGALQENRHHLAIMERNTNRLVQLTNQLLDFRQTESSGFRLDFELVDLRKILQETYDNFRLPAQQRKLQFDVQLPDVEVPAWADEESVNKIYSNLFSNAIKYGQTKVAAKLETSGGQVRLTVANDGPLIPEDMRERIFAPFVRLRENEKQKGTGIGLSICRSLTALHKGELSVTTENGLNIFTWSIPVGTFINLEN
ncbi:two-component regulator propeller domain-containing protein [Chitinophaga pollutisoli]|uniref:histidine kinase n=1 Tax=Chitinophaga pollutisoli TaxID=3133966 RepID=A0ABZ2YPW8_9BACT